MLGSSEQMDGDVAGSKIFVPGDETSSVPVLQKSEDGCMSLRVLQPAEDLEDVLDIEHCKEDRGILRRHIPITKVDTVLLWLHKSLVNLRALGTNESYQERLCRLEGDKESLVLQVEAQGEKIRDLENSLEKHQLKLNSAEEMLQQLLSRTALESQKLDLMDEVSFLELKLVSMEEIQNHSTERPHKAESVVNLISELQEQMCKIQQELSSKIQEKKPVKNQDDEDSGTDASLNEPAEAEGTSTGEQSSGNFSSEELCHCGKESNLLQELRLLKNKVEELEDEKSQYERKLKATKLSISYSLHVCYRSLVTHLLSLRLMVEQLQVERQQWEEHSRNLQAEISGLQQLLQCKNAEIENLQAQLLSRSPMSIDIAERDQELLKLKAGMELLIAANDEKDRRIEELSLLLSHCRQFRDCKASFQHTARPMSSSEEEEQSAPVKTKALTIKAHSESSQSNPENGKCILIDSNKSDSSESRSQESCQDGDTNQRKADRAEEPSVCDSSPVSSGVDSGEHSPVSQENLKNNKSIRKLWGKIRRTQSGGLASGDDLEPTTFRRGGFRATAGPRLARTPDSARSVRDMTVPFSNWTTEQVCGWLEDYGLGQYVNLTRQWVISGQTLLSATPQELEKEMGIKHPLHRKKLQLALRSFNNKTMEKSSELDHIWVTRWLDDIGLPQYKDQFHESRVDGRVLQYLTVNDLLFLKVTSQLHHLSIKCAIHVLHANKFNPHCLRRRPGDENKTSPSEVVQWSNHRVMEWLRSVDLAEYAPNLRGSGVHGGLIILEPRFTSETLAMLLNIPPQKTLLRRHLTTNFNSLVGTQAQQEKHEYANASGHSPLTTTAKVRPKKLGFTNFSHLRKRRPDDSADYICPVEMGIPAVVNGSVH
ncbi:liprin-beta-2 isoform X2 [Silurus meridionalis]|nr:liprin-beta-2 isoform X2 [Silurus meridionalis]